MTELLRHRLEQAADDRHEPLRTDVADLVVRARAARDRRRRTTLAAVVLTTAAVIGTGLGLAAALPGGDGEPAPTAPTATTSPSRSTDAAPPVPESQVVARCRPQLAKYADYPMYDAGPGVRWRPAHPDRDYTAGDVVALQDRGGLGNPVLCLLPEAGHADDPVPFTAFEPAADDTRLIRQLCAENLLPQPQFDPDSGEVSPGTGPVPDLRGARVVTSTRQGPVVAALLDLDGRPWSCFLSPVTWDAGLTSVGGAGVGLRNVSVEGATTGGSNKSIVDEAASWYLGAGTLPRRAATLEYLVQGRDPVRVPVRDGAYAFVVRDPGPGGLLPSRYRVLDRAGRVLYEQQDLQ